MSPPVDQLPPLIQVLQMLPPWVTHGIASAGGAIVSLAGVYLKLARDVSYIKGKIEIIAEDHDKFRATHEEVERLKRRFARFKSEHAPPLSHPRQSIY